MHTSEKGTNSKAKELRGKIFEASRTIMGYLDNEDIGFDLEQGSQNDPTSFLELEPTQERNEVLITRDADTPKGFFNDAAGNNNSML